MDLSSTATCLQEAPARPAGEPCWCFGSFVVWEAQRRVERAGEPVRLGPRSFDLLLQLLKRGGEFVGKEDLLASVWAGLVVEEGSVRVHMSTLRKALGEPAPQDGCGEWITNLPHRGYRFNGKVRREAADALAGLPARRAPAFAKAPARLTELVGRDAEVARILQALESYRLVTIAGAGGIGKTSVALRVAENVQAARAGADVVFIDLAPLISRDHVLGTMARLLGVAADMPDTVQGIAQCLAGRDVLLLIDNCEHVLDSLAPPVTALLRELPGLRVLATSREALRVAGEFVSRLPALPVPDSETGTLSEALRWPSVRLLVERARAAGAFAFAESHGPLLARIARQLDGIPLAIELIAARLGTQSLPDLAARLNDHMRLYSQGSRVALPRHRTLAAALEWSIALLDPTELRLFRQLSVFRGRFDVDSALGVAAGIAPEAACNALISLAGKSLVSFDGNDAIAPYRLLDTTRSYGAALLSASGDGPMLLRCHAAVLLNVMTDAAASLPKLAEQEWADRYALRLDDVRFALDQCLHEQPDAGTAAALVTASAPLWFHVSQVVEYRDWIRGALGLVERQARPDAGTAAVLRNALITALLHTVASEDELDVEFNLALEAALALGSPELELRARWGRCTHDGYRGAYDAALRNATAIEALVESLPDPSAVVLSHRMAAMANHFCARYEVSRRHSEAAVAIGENFVRTNVNMVGPDAVVVAQAMLCRTQWLQGQAEQALATASHAVARAQAIGHAVSLCAALHGACLVALWAGEQQLARKWVALMLEETRRRGLLGWWRYADWYLQGLQLEDAPDRAHHIRDVAGRLGSWDAAGRDTLATFCPEWIDDALVARVEAGAAPWVAPEVWRAAGWRSEQRGAVREAELFYLRAIGLSRQQGAVAWERRAAKSLAALRALQGRGGESGPMLEQCGRGQ